MRIQTRHPILRFNKTMNTLRDSLSAVTFAGDTLWVASDETTSVERLSTDDGLTFKHHKSFSLDGLITLPARGTDSDQEIDIEGMDFVAPYLWLIGSHSIKRKKVDSSDNESDQKLIKKLAKTEIDGNRFILARIPLIENSATGEMEPSLPASTLPGDTARDALTDALRNDQHLAKFLEMPGKENGFDVEGLACTADRVFIGLRGPVLRGWAVILEFSLADNDTQLALKNFATEGRPYRKHFLNLGGLGTRDLCVVGEDLLILAGPTMALDGPSTIYRWKGALNTTGDSLVRGDRLKDLLPVPFGSGSDHAEGITLIPDSHGPHQLLVVYDSPADQRKEGAAGIKADVFDLPA